MENIKNPENRKTLDTREDSHTSGEALIADIYH